MHCSKSLRQILILGDEGSSRDVDAVRNSCTNHLVSYLKTSREHKETLDHLQEECIKTCSLYDILCCDNVLESIDQCVSLNFKIDMLKTTNILQSLLASLDPGDADSTQPPMRYYDREKISAILVQLMEKQLSYNANGFVAKQALTEKCNSVAIVHLEHFRVLVECHIQSNLQDIPSTSHENWAKFLPRAANSLLGYVILVLLPLLLFDPQSKLEEHFQNAIDSALVPMWSRLYFHLNMSRDSGSFDEILWTFGYIKTFVRLTKNLCDEVCVVLALPTIYSFNHHEICYNLIREKSIRFVRAHVAAVLLFQCLQSRDQIAVFVESVLDIDNYFYLSNQIMKCKPIDLSTRCTPSTVFEVLLDSKAIFCRWVEIEFRYFSSCLRSTLVSSESVFGSGYEDSAESKCCSAIFECLRLFILAMKRYECLPAAPQEVLAELILERLLITTVGLFLLGIRSDAVLNAISKKSYLIHDFMPPNERILQGSTVVPRSFACLMSSATFFIEAIGLYFSTRAHFHVVTQNGRYNRNWTLVHKWIIDSPTIFSSSERRIPLDLWHLLWSDEMCTSICSQLEGRLTGRQDRISCTDTLENVCTTVKFQLMATKNVLELNWASLN